MKQANATTRQGEPFESLLQRYAGAWNAHDVQKIMSMHTDDTVYTLHGSGQTYRGREDVTRGFAADLKRIPDIHFELRAAYGSDTHIVFESVVTGTTPDGVPVLLEGVDVLTMRGGKVVTKDSYFVRRPGV